MKRAEKFDGEKRTEKVSLLVFHCFALKTGQLLEIFRKTGTSVHYIIQRNGKILSLVEEDKVARHAGLASWAEFPDSINAKSIGIELQNSQMGNQRYTAIQVKSLIKLAKEIIKRHGIKACNIVGHSDIAPYRKPDPGKFFPWRELAKKGIGIWPEVENCVSVKSFERTKAVQMLKIIGYNVTDETAALYAFVVRFMPQKIDVQSDIIRKEAEVFDFWRGVTVENAAEKIKEAPKIYPPKAEKLWRDTEILSRIEQVSEVYKRERKKKNC